MNAHTPAANSKFVYVTFIRTTPEKLWAALTTPEFIRAYFFGVTMESDWKKGSPWKMVGTDSGKTFDDGEVIECDPPKKLVLSWWNRWKPELAEEGESRMTYDIEQVDGSVRLTVIHEIGRSNSKLIEGVSGGWPQILSSLKTYLETGEALTRPIHKAA